MVLKIQHFVAFITIGCALCCKHSPPLVSKIEGKQIPIHSDLAGVDSIETYIYPYRIRINEVLDSTLAYAATTISKDDGTYNTPAGNMMADIVFSQANPVFESRTGKQIDFVLLNHGGIRSIISKGKVSARTAYEVMPFENSIVVVELSGKSVLALVDYLIASNRAHPVSGVQLILDTQGKLNSFSVQGKPFDPNRNYFVATSDYLALEGGGMDFFKNAIGETNIDYLIRNAMIDHFKKVDTLAPVIDNRFMKLRD